MKKFLAVIMSMILCLSFVGCSNGTKESAEGVVYEYEITSISDLEDDSNAGVDEAIEEEKNTTITMYEDKLVYKNADGEYTATFVEGDDPDFIELEWKKMPKPSAVMDIDIISSALVKASDGRMCLAFILMPAKENSLPMVMHKFS